LSKNVETKIKKIVSEMEGRLGNDPGIPRNIKRSIQDASAYLLDASKDTDLRVSGAISILADVSNDVNMPMDSWSTIMQILSELEIVLKSLN